MIEMVDALRLIEDRRGDAVVVSTMIGSQGWQQVSRIESLDLPITGGMGKASSVALGISLARPDRKVIVIDGDGSLVMNLGSLVTIAGKAPENLYHFVLENGVYAVTGGQPIPNAGGLSFAGLARAAGYASAFEFDDLEEWVTSVDEVMSSKGPVLACIKTVPEVEHRPISERPRGRSRSTPQAIKEFAQALRE